MIRRAITSLSSLHLAWLSGASFGAAGLSLITSSLITRALGPQGRGELAGVSAPLALAQVLLTLGMGDFLRRETARGVRPLNVLVGVSAVPVVAMCAAVALGARPLAGNLTGDGTSAARWLTISLVALPLTCCGGLLLDVLAGKQRWGIRALFTLVPALFSTAAVVTLYAIGQITVASVAGTAVVVGVGTSLAAATFTRAAFPLRYDRALTRQALHFGTQVWIGRAAGIVNLRVDQLVLLPLVSRAELGRYAVAATLGSIPILLTGPVGQVLEPKVARGEIEDLPLLLRRACAATTFFVVGLAAATSFLLTRVMGQGFGEVRGCAWILEAASVPYLVRYLIKVSLTARGEPMAGSKAEVVALGFTVAGLAVLAPRFGIVGAAVTSLAAYSVSLIVLLRIAGPLLDVPSKTLIVGRLTSRD